MRSDWPIERPRDTKMAAPMDVVATDAVKFLIKCADFAAVKHKDQRRKDPEKTPYINHPIGANITHISDLDCEEKSRGHKRRRSRTQARN